MHIHFIYRLRYMLHMLPKLQVEIIIMICNIYTYKLFENSKFYFIQPTHKFVEIYASQPLKES